MLFELFIQVNNRQEVVVQVVYEKGILTIYKNLRW